MANFPGGSAWAMAREIAEGYLLVNDRTFARFGAAEINKLGFELDRYLREVRGEHVPVEERERAQKRQRRMQRLSNARMMLNAYRQKRKI